MNRLAITLALLSATATPAVAQQPDTSPRAVAGFDVGAATTAPLQLTKTVHLEATPATVFALISDHEAMPVWLPGLHRVSVERSPAGGVARTCTLENGASVKESIVGYRQNSLLAYSAAPGNPFGLGDHLGVAQVEAADGGTLLTWRQYFEHQAPETITPMLDGMMQAGLENLAKRFGGGHYGTATGTSALSIRQSVEVAASPDRVWQILGRDFGGLDKWASLVPHASLTQLPSGATQRQCSTAIGEFKETVTEYDEARRRLAYRVDAGTPPVVSEMTNAWQVMPVDGGRSRVEMEMTVQLIDDAPAAVAEGMKANFAAVTRQLTEELRHYVETGRPHPRKLAAAKQ